MPRATWTACCAPPLTVEQFLKTAPKRGVCGAARAGLDGAVLAAVGGPTAGAARDAGIDVAVVPDEAAFEARAAVSRL